MKSDVVHKLINIFAIRFQLWERIPWQITMSPILACSQNRNIGFCHHSVATNYCHYFWPLRQGSGASIPSPHSSGRRSLTMLGSLRSSVPNRSVWHAIPPVHQAAAPSWGTDPAGCTVRISTSNQTSYQRIRSTYGHCLWNSRWGVSRDQERLGWHIVMLGRRLLNVGLGWWKKKHRPKRLVFRSVVVATTYKITSFSEKCLKSNFWLANRQKWLTMQSANNFCH